MTHVTCRLTAKNRDQLRSPTLGHQVWATFAFFYLLTYYSTSCRQSSSKTDSSVDCCSLTLIRRRHRAAVLRHFTLLTASVAEITPNDWTASSSPDDCGLFTYPVTLRASVCVSVCVCVCSHCFSCLCTFSLCLTLRARNVFKDNTFEAKAKARDFCPQSVIDVDDSPWGLHPCYEAVRQAPWSWPCGSSPCFGLS